MSSTFSFSRLGKLITKDLFENSRLYIFSVLALLGLLSLVFAFWGIASAPFYHEQGAYFIFFTGLFIAGTVFSSMSFSMLGNKDKGVYWLSIPSTHLEKLMCTIFYSTVVFTIVYCLCFFLVKSVAVSFLTAYIKAHPGSSYTTLDDQDNEVAEVFRYLLYSYFAVQSLYLLGSVYFRRYSFIITTVVGASFIFLFVYYLTRVEHTVLGNGNWDLFSVKKTNSTVKDGFLLYSISPALSNILKYAIQFAWAPLFWVVTWFRLKEKEI